MVTVWSGRTLSKLTSCSWICYHALLSCSTCVDNKLHKHIARLDINTREVLCVRSGSTNLCFRIDHFLKIFSCLICKSKVHPYMNFHSLILQLHSGRCAVNWQQQKLTTSGKCPMSHYDHKVKYISMVWIFPFAKESTYSAQFVCCNLSAGLQKDYWLLM